MGQYRYLSIMQALNDGKAPNDNIKKGDEILKAGKHKSDEISYITSDKDMHTINFEQSELFDAGESKYTEKEIIEKFKQKLIEDGI